MFDRPKFTITMQNEDIIKGYPEVAPESVGNFIELANTVL